MNGFGIIKVACRICLIGAGFVDRFWVNRQTVLWFIHCQYINKLR